ncbi:MDR family MFS transporter [Aestuariimicrobium kwangyangense]|uniref:MDR family MFS transporter n=1 Tax=Aestuariimicrobium kwangyangense TaxID=396389 RepID=UPI0003B6BA4F|nr:MDR family MFS transporter [Aestuariimicrobium kwangyangense]
MSQTSPAAATSGAPTPDSDISAPMSHRGVLEALTGLLLGMFVSMLASTVVSSSLPVIVHDLAGTERDYTWVITAMLLTSAISTPVWGKLADLFNRKVLFQIAIIVFVLASATAGFAQNPGMMIASRAVQGLGAGGLAALSQVIMADIISPRDRGRYMGLFGAVMAVSTVGGPLLGGVITDSLGWRWNFFVALPVAVLALIMVQLTLHLRPNQQRKVSIDHAGIVLLGTSVSLLLIWVTNAGHDYGWWSFTTAWMVGGALIAAIAFVVVELRSSEPLIPLSLFRSRTFSLSVLASIATGIAMFGSSVFLSQYMQLARGASPTMAGVMTIPMVAGLLLSSMVVGQLISRYGIWKPYVVAGSVSLIAGLYLLTTIHYDTNFWLVSIYMFLMGAGVGMTMQNLVLVVQNTTGASLIGVASSGVTFFRSLGGTIGVSVMGAAMATRTASLAQSRQSDIGVALKSLGEQGGYWAQQLASGAVPRVSEMPPALRVVLEDIYSGGITHSFWIAVPVAAVSLVAVLLLPNAPLTRMTAAERRDAGERDLAVVSVPQGMEVLDHEASPTPVLVEDDDSDRLKV